MVLVTKGRDSRGLQRYTTKYLLGIPGDFRSRLPFNDYDCLIITGGSIVQGKIGGGSDEGFDIYVTEFCREK